MQTTSRALCGTLSSCLHGRVVQNNAHNNRANVLKYSICIAHGGPIVPARNARFVLRFMHQALSNNYRFEPEILILFYGILVYN